MKALCLTVLLIALFVPAQASVPLPAQAEDTEARIMQRVQEHYCSQLLFARNASSAVAEVSYGFSCMVSAGHSLSAQLRRYADHAAAEQAFADERGETRHCLFAATPPTNGLQ